MEKIIIFGTSDGTKLMYHSLSRDPAYEVAAFTVDKKYLTEETFCGLPVVPFEEVQTIYPPGDYKMFVALLANNMNKLRAQKYSEAIEKGYALISYIHPQAIVADDVVIGDNCYISEGVILRPNIVIGNDVIIFAGVCIGHECIIKDHCYFGNRAVMMGGVTIESYCVVGPNSTIMEDLKIAAECLIGGGAVIQHNTGEKDVYKANEATLLPLKSDQLAKIVFRKRR